MKLPHIRPSCYCNKPKEEEEGFRCFSCPFNKENLNKDYVFPEEIILDKESLERFEAEINNPTPPNAALKKLMSRPDNKRCETCGIPIEYNYIIYNGNKFCNAKCIIDFKEKNKDIK